jgi:hypothetical protein
MGKILTKTKWTPTESGMRLAAAGGDVELAVTRRK